MALRTKLVILVLTSLITNNLCENDVLKLSIDDGDLLRGSGEEKENLEKEIELEDKSELEEYTTTEYATTDEAYMVTLNDLRIDTTVESTTEDNGVVRTAVPEDIYNASNIVKAETTTSPPTRATESMEGMSPRIAEFDGEETNQRSPKLTESARPEPQPHDQPVFDPSPPEAITPQATLRNWLEDPWLRAPAGLLVPLRSSALVRASAVWDDLNEESLGLSDVVLVGYHANGINWRSRHNLQGNGVKNGYTAVSDALNKLLVKYQGLSETSDGTMQALISATKLVPYDSALFVLTDRAPGDLHRLPLAVRALVEKRLKVYTIWTNPSLPAFDIEQQIQGLKNVSKHTEGEVLTYTLGLDMGASDMDRMHSEVQAQPRRARLNAIEEDEKFETLLVRRGGGGATSLGIPVEYGVTALKIYIKGDVEHAVLYPPNDAPQVDLYNMTSVRAFSAASRTDELSPREVFLVFPGTDPQNEALKVLPMKPVDSPSAQAGMWHLSVRCDTCNYHLRVLARAQLHFHASLKATDMLKIRIVGPVASVRESALVDEYGAELTKLPFSYQPIAGDGQDVPQDSPMTEIEETIPLPNVKAKRVYVRILGRDIRGEPFVRLSGPLNEPEVRLGRSAILEFEDLDRAEEANIAFARLRLGYNDSNVLPYNRATSQVVNQQGTIMTAVQIGLSTRLYGSPGDNLQLHFEVTNYRDQSVRFSFEARGELRFLTGISPSSQTVLSGQTVNVVVSVSITSTAQPGARDLITFTAIGIDQVSISAYVYVVNTVDSVDIWAPELRHTFQGTCIGRQGDDCAQHIWSTTITARDASSGLLRLTSIPIGLVYDSNFISGTREEIRAIYRATCCAPRLSVTAVDANGNVNSYIIDISGYLNSASIAAITLGIFLAIAIILLIIFLIYWCVRRRKESRELPYSTSTRN
ncbi:uncharacterized protein LOC134753253 isoform X1 [Cydia strobilella]|uniref:uncharacterized protein LOC134753253 isoform X1 n=1 Tax=Cydia strobilella TaxID=1100964 RepID=UPI00300429EA